MRSLPSLKFRNRFDQIKNAKKSLLCVGLDPEVEKFPIELKKDPDALFLFCRTIIEATAPFAAAYKINFAFFERFGASGWQTIEQLVAEIPEDCLSIADAKRGDIGNSARHYAEALFKQLGFDAVTVNPYMGWDSAEPFVQWHDKFVFFLGLTSNAGAADFQYYNQNLRPLYSYIAEKVESWNEAGNCGLVVGATKPQQFREIRNVAPSLTFLIPGIGAQGGSVEVVLQNLGDTNGFLSASRSILYASDGDDFAEAAAQEARRLQQLMKHVFV
ncbi:MAG: orotidine-5'-phosphate decarboxylase [Deferribacteres bacterium]|nr:orotidine-5'-phosphate decarboxylase [candidate division KSB1 bacterium]MCB9500737.1 orotidine-5'-phosphate decarboxylase [Deferribacteres bacterium]